MNCRKGTHLKKGGSGTALTREKRTDKINLPSLTLLSFARRVKLERFILSVLFSLVSALPEPPFFKCVPENKGKSIVNKIA